MVEVSFEMLIYIQPNFIIFITLVDFHEDKNVDEKNSDAENSDDDDGRSKVSMSSTKSSRIERAPVKVFQVQPPFQSGSTPVHLEHRFMLWNHKQLQIPYQ